MVEMQMETILVSGGAGFIGSHLVEVLTAKGYCVKVLDFLVPQVHGEKREKPKYTQGVEFIYGDVNDFKVWERALEGVSVVFHFAAEVGVGQSMYEITRYVRANTLGTAVLLELIASQRYPIRRLVVASSMSIYGEGLYECKTCGPVNPPLRSVEQLEKRAWEMNCPYCQRQVNPKPTTEEKTLAPASIYAITKRDQEEMCLVVGRAYGIPTIALRFFNVYGPRQSLSNPYTGVVAIFSSRLSLKKPPVVFEDGHQTRDFVHVSDIVQACLLALDRKEVQYEAFNIGTGRATAIRHVSDVLGKALGFSIQPAVTGNFRAGDIRHCIADISKAKHLLGYSPRVSLEDGIHNLMTWLAQEKEITDLVDRATQELIRRKLAR